MQGEEAAAKRGAGPLSRLTLLLDGKKKSLLLLAFPVIFVAALSFWYSQRTQAIDAFDACQRSFDAVDQAPDDADLLKAIFTLCDRALHVTGLSHKERAIVVYGRGVGYSQRNEPDLAMDDFTEAIKQDPNFQRPYVFRGQLHEKRGEIDQALADYDVAIRLDPKDVAALVNRGHIRYGKGESDLALGDFNQAIDVQPDLAEAYANRGLIFADRGNDDAAIADQSKAIQLRPNLGAAYNNRGRVYNRTGKSDLALADLTKAINLLPGMSEPFYNRGEAYRMLGDYDRAIGDYNQALRIAPDMAAALYGRGISYFGLNHRSNQGLADLLRSVEIDPDLQQAHNVLCYLLATAGRAADALPYCDRAVALDPMSLMALGNRAYAYLWLKDWPHAIDGFTDYLQRSPDAADIQFMRGYAHERAGEKQAAMDDYAAARAASPGIDDDMRDRYGIVAGSAEIRMQL